MLLGTLAAPLLGNVMESVFKGRGVKSTGKGLDRVSRGLNRVGVKDFH